MTLLLLLLASFAATTQMTIFSYVVSRVAHEPYEEPFLLSVLVSQFNINDTTTNRYLGWGIHYALGLLFVLTFHTMLSVGLLSLSWKSVLLYGSATGLVGIVGWQFMFMQSANKPRMNYIGYYTQLVIAHIVFAFTMAACYIIL